MRKSLVIPCLILFWAAPLCFAETGSAGKKLIPVKPSYHEATSIPAVEEPALDPTVPAPPTPREQMYVFWILGKMLSYPIDKAEAYIYSFKKKEKPRVEGAPTPATATPNANPFNSVNWSEIPPAPPAAGHSGRAR